MSLGSNIATRSFPTTLPGYQGQFGFFDADRRLAAITAKGDPLQMMARVVPFESFRAEIEAAVLNTRFLGSAIEDSIPDGTTLWLFLRRSV